MTSPSTTSESVWDVVYRMARHDPRIVFVGSDLNPTLLGEMREELPEQFFMAGISEQHLLGAATGMAMAGALPVVSTIATFLTRRCFEQLVVDLALHQRAAVLLATGPGVAYHFFGPTHCAVDDFALLRTIPGMTTLSPASMAEAAILLEQALVEERLAYLRVPRPDYAPLEGPRPHIGSLAPLRAGNDVLLLSTGALGPNAVGAANQLQADNISVAVTHLNTISPLNGDALRDAVAPYRLIVTVEEHLRDGGLGTALLELLSDHPTRDQPVVLRIGLPKSFVQGYGTWADAIEAAALDATGIADAVRDRWIRCGFTASDLHTDQSDPPINSSPVWDA